MKNDFILHIKHHDINEAEKIFRKLIAQKGFHATLLFNKKFEQEYELFYRVQLTPTALVKFKKKLDEHITCDLIELFEFKHW